MNRRGFTIVELVIVITVMGILMILGVVNLRGSEVNGRDSERKADIDTIALHLETFYTSGTDGSTTFGYYPSTDSGTMVGLTAQKTTLRDIDEKNLVAPGAPDDSTTSLVVATNNISTTAGVLPQPQSADNQNQYVYQPLKSDGSLCTLTTEECSKFNLYYMLEKDSTVYMVTSRNQ